MDFPTLKAQLEASRVLSAEVEGARFQLKAPTDHAWRVTLQAHMNRAGKVQEAAAFRELLESAITGWEGVTCAHFDPAAGADPVPFTPGARALLLDERPDLADELIDQIVLHRHARHKRLEEERKNS